MQESQTFVLGIQAQSLRSCMSYIYIRNHYIYTHLINLLYTTNAT